MVLWIFYINKEFVEILCGICKKCALRNFAKFTGKQL